MSSVQPISPHSPVRSLSQRVGAKRRGQKHHHAPRQVLGVPPLQATCEA